MSLEDRDRKRRMEEGLEPIITTNYDFKLMMKDVPLAKLRNSFPSNGCVSLNDYRELKPYIPEKNFKFQFDGKFSHVGKMNLTKFAKIFGPVLP